MTTTLLAVDDSKTMRKVIEITFAGEDFRTVLAENADDALRKLDSERPALALLDAGLAGTSGYDLCQKLKATHPNVLVLLLSSRQQPYDRVRGTSAGADDFIDKPFDTQQLIDKVKALSAKRAQAPAPAPVLGGPRVGATPAGPPVRAPFDAPGAARPAAGIGFGAPKPATAPGFPAAQARPNTDVAAPRFAEAAPAPQAARGPLQADIPTAAPPAPGAYGFRPQAAAAAPAPVVAVVPAVAPAAAPSTNGVAGDFAGKLGKLGLSAAQIEAVLALSREVVEQVVWEVVPTLAETIIKEEIRRLTAESA